MAGYVPATEADTTEMLAALGLATTDDLYSEIDSSSLVAGALDLPAGTSELEVRSSLGALAAQNTVFASCFRGAGSYRHHIPAVVRRVTANERFVTAYTPYQAEISQGVLQSIFEYQTQICELYGMDVSNASVYDGSTAAAEAVLMCEERKRSGVVVAGTVDPQTLEVIETYCSSRGVPVVLAAVDDAYRVDMGALEKLLAGEPTAAGEPAAAGGAEPAKPPASVFVQSPNYHGCIEDVAKIVEVAHAAGAKVVMSANPVSLGLLATPGELGVDVAVGEGQPLGLPMSFGGPYLGIMCCTQKMMRKLPGRIVGQTTDADGRRCFVLTLQAREQHIRREKASSNICSNEALCAMTASVYLATMGPVGIRQVAESCAANAHYLAAELTKIDGFDMLDADSSGTPVPYFHEFATTSPIPPLELERRLAERGILSGLPISSSATPPSAATPPNHVAEIPFCSSDTAPAPGTAPAPAPGTEPEAAPEPDAVLWCATELNRRADVDALVAAVREVVSS